MAHSTEFNDHIVHDVMGHIPGITSRAMFGGYGIYRDGVFFACIIDSVLYFKVDKTNKVNYEKLGSKQFAYDMKGKKMSMSYYEVPEEVMEDREKFDEWADLALTVAMRAKKKKHPR